MKTIFLCFCVAMTVKYIYLLSGPFYFSLVKILIVEEYLCGSESIVRRIPVPMKFEITVCGYLQTYDAQVMSMTLR